MAVATTNINRISSLTNPISFIKTPNRTVRKEDGANPAFAGYLLNATKQTMNTRKRKDMPKKSFVIVFAYLNRPYQLVSFAIVYGIQVPFVAIGISYPPL